MPSAVCVLRICGFLAHCHRLLFAIDKPWLGNWAVVEGEILGRSILPFLFSTQSIMTELFFLFSFISQLSFSWICNWRNTILQYFQCIFRKPKECKERHKILMDRTSGDGADSAKDPGSSQSYLSTLPGIPKAWILLLFGLITHLVSIVTKNFPFLSLHTFFNLFYSLHISF